MAETHEAVETTAGGGEEAVAAAPVRRSPGHRAMDVRDAVAELTARAHEISAEASNKMAGAMRDVIGAAAGFASFAIESARDLVQYMVRRGQMSQDEADRLLRDAEAAVGRQPKPPTTDGAAAQPSVFRAKAAKPPAAEPEREPARPAPKVAAKATKPAAKSAAPAKAPAKAAPKVAAKAPAKGAKPAAKAAKSSPKSAAKAPAKAAKPAAKGASSGAKAPAKSPKSAKPAKAAPKKKR